MRDLITPVIAAIGGQPDFSALAFTINGSRFAYGSFLNAVLAFLVLAAAIYFIVVLPLQKMLKKPDAESSDSDVRACPECLAMIPSEANRCMYCTSIVGPASAAQPPAPAS